VQYLRELHTFGRISYVWYCSCGARGQAGRLQTEDRARRFAGTHHRKAHPGVLQQPVEVQGRGGGAREADPER